MIVTKQDLDNVFEEYRGKYEGRKEDYFALLYLAKEFKRPAEDLVVQVAFGGNDYGLDAFHIDKERRNLYLYQFKWSENHNLFKDSFERLNSKGIEQIFGNPTQDPAQNQLLLQLKSSLNENQAIVERVLIQFVFNGDPSDAEQSVVLDSLREDLERKKYFMDQYFARKISLAFEFKSNETRKVAAAMHARKTYEYDVGFDLAASKETPTGEKLYAGFLSLMSLYDIYREMGQRFFERNIRSGLSADKPPNRAIQRALRSVVLDEIAPPETFVFNHNGVTLSAQEFVSLNGKYRIIEPRLLNGAQTLTSLDKFLKDNERNIALKRNEQRLRNIAVLTKIVCSSSEDFIVNVTICNNKQNPVEPWQLRANDRIQLSFQDRFRDELKIYYERQESAFENLSDDDLQNMGVEQLGKAIQIRPLAQTFLAMQGEVDKMSRLRDVFENEKFYKDTFRDSYLKCDPRRIILAYKIQMRLNKVIDEIKARGENKYSYVGHARNLVWSLLVQGLLNDPDLPQLCNRYGEDLVMEADYNSYLKKMAANQVRTILNKAFDDPQYRKYISEEKYSFLRTKETCLKCLDVARKRCNWTKLSF